MKLYAPEAYFRLSPEAKREIVNGCGPGKFSFLIPDTMYGLDVSAACDIHDYMYFMGETIEDKKEADRVFMNNLLRIIEAKTQSKILSWLRKRRAVKYFSAVAMFGGPAFWNAKNPNATMRDA